MKKIFLLCCCLGFTVLGFGQALRLDSLVLYDNIQVLKPGLKQLGRFTAGPDTLLLPRRTLLPASEYTSRKPDPWVGIMQAMLKLEVYVSAEEKVTEEIISASGTLGGFEYKKIQLTQNPKTGRWEGRARYNFYLPSHVGEKTLKWNWQQKNGDIFGKTETRLLTVAGKPLHPQEIPMLPLLEVACRLGEGRVTKVDLMAQMTKGTFHFLNQEHTAAYDRLGHDFLFQMYDAEQQANLSSLVFQELLPALLHTESISRYDCRVAALFLVNVLSAVGVPDLQVWKISKPRQTQTFKTQKIYHKCYQNDKQFLEKTSKFNFHAAVTTPLLDSVPFTLAMDPTFMLLDSGENDINPGSLFPWELYLDHFVDPKDRDSVSIDSSQLLVANAKNLYHVPKTEETFSETLPLDQLNHFPPLFTSTAAAIDLFTELHFVNLQPFGQIGMNYVWVTPNKEIRLDMIHLDVEQSDLKQELEHFPNHFSGEVVPMEAKHAPGKQAWKSDQDFLAFHQGEWIVQLRKNESTSSIDLIEMAHQLVADLKWKPTKSQSERRSTSKTIDFGTMKLGDFFRVPDSFFPWERIQKPRSHLRLLADNGCLMELEHPPNSTSSIHQDLDRKVYFYPSATGTVTFRLFLNAPPTVGWLRDAKIEVVAD